MMHLCVSKQTIIGSDNGLVPGRHQAIVRTNSEIMLIEPLGIHIFSFKKMHLKNVIWKMAAILSRLQFAYLLTIRNLNYTTILAAHQGTFLQDATYSIIDMWHTYDIMIEI